MVMFVSFTFGKFKKRENNGCCLLLEGSSLHFFSYVKSHLARNDFTVSFFFSLTNFNLLQPSTSKRPVQQFFNRQEQGNKLLLWQKWMCTGIKKIAAHNLNLAVLFLEIGRWLSQTTYVLLSWNKFTRTVFVHSPCNFQIFKDIKIGQTERFQFSGLHIPRIFRGNMNDWAFLYAYNFVTAVGRGWKVLELWQIRLATI